MREFRRARDRNRGALKGIQPEVSVMVQGAHGNGGGAANDSLLATTAHLLKQNDREVRQIAVRLAQLIPVGASVRMLVKIAGSALDGTPDATEVVEVIRPGVSVNMEIPVEIRKG